MLVGTVLLLSFHFGSEWLVQRFHLPLSGPVLGMALLTVALALRGQTPAGLARVSNLLLRAMPLFFIPAGVGVIVLSEQFRAAWLPISAALLGSTLLAIATTAIIMKAVTRLLARSTSKPSP
ncbi:MAG TPA: CidA/LrgA family protein [Polyangia bacterium]